MTLLFVDSFDHYATADLTEKWATLSGSPTITASAGRRGTSGLVFDGAEYVTIGFSSVATAVVGVAIKVTNFPTSSAPIICLQDSGTYHVSLFIDPSGTLTVKRGTVTGSPTTLGASSATLSQDVWHYVEFKATINDSTGSYYVNIDGALVLSGTGADTRNSANATVNTLLLGIPVGSSVEVIVDDLYLLDTAGSVNNDFLGDVRVDAYVPDGAGTTTQFTPLSGSNYANVDDATPDDDTTYVESSTVGHIDLYTITDISHTPSTIHGVQVCMNAKKDDAGAREIKEKCRSASTNYSGAAQALSTSYAYYRQIRETDPATSAAWSKANLNSAQFGIEVAS